MLPLPITQHIMCTTACRICMSSVTTLTMLKAPLCREHRVVPAIYLQSCCGKNSEDLGQRDAECLPALHFDRGGWWQTMIMHAHCWQLACRLCCLCSLRCWRSCWGTPWRPSGSGRPCCACCCHARTPQCTRSAPSTQRRSALCMLSSATAWPTAGTLSSHARCLLSLYQGMQDVGAA